MGKDTDWKQLTFTSADAVSGRAGGWGVKATSADIGEGLAQLLRRGVTTQLEDYAHGGGGMPQFPTARDLEHRTRRMRYDREPDGVSLLWHSVAAGQDATGRPGNVFTHAAAGHMAPGLRPIQMWRSADWLTPFGHLETAAANLPDGLRPGRFITRESVVEFIRSGERLYSLEWLLAAVAHVRATRTVLYVQVEDTDEAALWLGAIAFLTSAAHAAELTFVTFERRTTIESGAADGGRIVFVPPGDLDGVAAQGEFLYLDPRRPLDDSDPTRWAGQGQVFPAAPDWQNASLDALANDRAVELLEAIDDLTDGLEPTEVRGLPLAWPLSTVLLSEPGERIDGRDERLADCLAVCPARLLSSARVSTLLAEADQNPSVRRRLAEVLPPGSAALNELAVRDARRYLDGGWTAEVAPEPVRLDRADPRVQELEAAAVAATRTIVDSAAPPVPQARQLLAFAVDSGLLSPEATGSAHDGLLVQAQELLGPLPAAREIPRTRSPLPSAPADAESADDSRPEHEVTATQAAAVVADRAAPTMSSLGEQVSRLLEDFPDTSAERQALRRALLVIEGVRPPELLSTGPGFPGAAEHAIRLLQQPCRDVAADAVRWLARYVVLGQVGLIDPTPAPNEVMGRVEFIEALGRDPHTVVGAVADLVASAPEGDAAKIVWAWCTREALGLASGSVQLLLHAVDGSTLGRLAVREGLARSDRARGRRVLEQARERVSLGDLGSGRATALGLVDEARSALATAGGGA